MHQAQVTSVTLLHFSVCSQDKLLIRFCSCSCSCSINHSLPPICLKLPSPILATQHPPPLTQATQHPPFSIFSLNSHRHRPSNVKSRNFGSATVPLGLIHQLKCKNKTSSIRTEQERQKGQKSKKKRKPPNLLRQARQV